jgi:hypothetical protein
LLRSLHNYRPLLVLKVVQVQVQVQEQVPPFREFLLLLSRSPLPLRSQYKALASPSFRSHLLMTRPCV